MCTENDRKQDQFRIHACILYNDFLVFRVVFVFFRGFIGLFSVFRVISVSFRGFTGFVLFLGISVLPVFVVLYQENDNWFYHLYIYIYTKFGPPKP